MLKDQDLGRKIIESLSENRACNCYTLLDGFNHREAEMIKNRNLCVERSKFLKRDINVENFKKYFIEIHNDLVFKMKYEIVPDDAFFNRDWAGGCRGRWAGPGLLAGWAAGSWIVGAEVRLLQCGSAGSGRGTPLQEEQERRGVSEGFTRGRSDA